MNNNKNNTTVEVKKSTHNNCDFAYWDIEEMGREEIGNVQLCPTCYDNRDVPLGELLINYKYQWENLKCIFWTIKGNRTLVTRWKCEKCGYRREEETTYRRSSKRFRLNDIRELLGKYIERTNDSINNYKENFLFGQSEEDSTMIATFKGHLEAYKQVLKLLKGEK